MPGSAVADYPDALPVAFGLAKPFVLTFPVAVPLAIDQPVREPRQHEQLTRKPYGHDQFAREPRQHEQLARKPYGHDQSPADRVSDHAERHQCPGPDGHAVSFGIYLAHAVGIVGHLGDLSNGRDA